MTLRLVTQTKHKRASICLAMIVRDEAHVIERCLNSCRETISYLRVIDTGSKDNTVDLIRAWAKKTGTDFKIKTSEWKNFRDNRNELLDFACKCAATHLLLIDADEILHIRPEQIGRLKQKLMEIPKPAFVIPMLEGKGVCARINLVVNDRKRIQYHYAMHEELWIDGDDYPNSILMGHPADYYAGPHVTTPQDGARSNDPDRLQRDFRLLQDALGEDGNPRYLFYMAQTLRTGAHLKNDQEAWKVIRETYERYLRATEGQRNTYRYVAALWVARVSELLGEDPKTVVRLYLRCHKIDELRPEALGSCAAYCFDLGLLDLAEEAASGVAACKGSTNFAFCETHWYTVAGEILTKLKGVAV